MTLCAVSPCALAKSRARFFESAKNRNHHLGFHSVPTSARWRRSLSLTIPTILPSSVTTGTPLMRFSTIRAAMSRTDVRGVTVATSRVMISFAFIGELLNWTQRDRVTARDEETLTLVNLPDAVAGAAYIYTMTRTWL